MANKKEKKTEVDLAKEEMKKELDKRKKSGVFAAATAVAGGGSTMRFYLKTR